MLAQRGGDIARPQPARKKAARDEHSPPSILVERKAGKRRLSFNEKHALDTLPGRIAALQADIERLRRQLDDPDLYARDAKAFADISAAMTVAQEGLIAAEETWLELEILREEIDGT
jgi:ATP-binding cassette subfamily F protein uup